jgi:hypothetical protein
VTLPALGLPILSASAGAMMGVHTRICSFIGTAILSGMIWVSINLPAGC